MCSAGAANFGLWNHIGAKSSSGSIGSGCPCHSAVHYYWALCLCPVPSCPLSSGLSSSWPQSHLPTNPIISHQEPQWSPDSLHPHSLALLMRASGSPTGVWCFLRFYVTEPLSWVTSRDYLQLFTSSTCVLLQFRLLSVSFSFPSSPPSIHAALWPWAVFSLGTHPG